MPKNKLLASEAAAKALRLRKQLGIPLDQSLSALDAAESLGIEVRLVDLPSMEGMYVAGNAPKILLSALRPQGRRNFTCAHEIGHDAFGHGEQFDEMTEEKSTLRKNDPREFAADCFAAYFLMPKVTIDNGMKRRRITYQSLEPVHAYALASWLGVGYGTLVSHLQHGVGMISRDQAQHLAKVQPRDIRAKLLGYSVTENLHLADEHWLGRAIDCEVGDLLLLPKGTQVEGKQLAILEERANNTLLQTRTPGIARVANEMMDWAAFIRVSRHNYVGRSCYRFEEEVDE